MSSGGEIDEEGQDKDKSADHVRPIYLTNAEVFAYDERRTKGWASLASTKVPTSIAFDDTRGGIHRILAVDEEGHRVIINSAISAFLDFHKTSDRFGYWTDQATGVIYGVGFGSEYEQQQFMEVLENCKGSQQCWKSNNKLVPPPKKIYRDLQPPNLHGGDNISKASRVPPPPTQIQDTQDISFILAPQQNQTKDCGDYPKTKDSLEDLRVKAPRNQMRLITRTSSGEESCVEKPVQKINPGASRHCQAQVSVTEKKPSPQESEKMKEMKETISNIHRENAELKQSLEKSAEQVRRWMEEMEELKVKNGRLVNQVENKTTEVEECKKTGFTLQQEVDRLKDAGRSNDHKLKNAQALTERLDGLKDEKRKLETTVAALAADDEAANAMNSSTTLDISAHDAEFSREAARLEEHYKKVLKSIEMQLEDAQKTKAEGQVRLTKLGPTFLQTIHELISVHGQIKSAFQDQLRVLDMPQQSMSTSSFPYNATQPTNSWSTSYKF